MNFINKKLIPDHYITCYYGYKQNYKEDRNQNYFEYNNARYEVSDVGDIMGLAYEYSIVPASFIAPFIKATLKFEFDSWIKNGVVLGIIIFVLIVIIKNISIRRFFKSSKIINDFKSE